jgi:membrane protein DedA with SNARE-associated domain
VIRHRTRVLVTAAWLIASGATIVYAQGFIAQCNDVGGLVALVLSLCGALFGAAGAWFGIGFRVKENTKTLERVCNWQEKHDDWHTAQEDKLDRILRVLDRQ